MAAGEGQRNLFNEPSVSIPDNPTLERAAIMLLKLVEGDPSLLNGEKVGEIDRKLRFALYMDQGLRDILTPDQVGAVEEFLMDSKRCIDPEVINRARRWLVEHDRIRLPAKAVQAAERDRSRLSSAFKG